MKFDNKELEELMTINQQAKILVRSLTYCDELEEELFNCMKNKVELPRNYVQRAHNNYLVLCLIGLNQCDSEVFKKIDNYMDNEYYK